MEIKINGIYRHFKGNLYKVLSVAKHTENLTDLVIYQDCNDSTKIWARPLDMWNETVVVNDTEISRFSLVK